MKHLLSLCLSLIITGQALSQIQDIGVGTSANDRTGDPIRTAFQKVNSNFDYLDARATASGTDTYTASISPAITSYVTGQRFYITFTNANTGASTLNLNSLGAKSIVKQGSTALAANDIRAGQTLELIYDGTNLQIVGDLGTIKEYGIACSDLTTALTTGTNKAYFRIPRGFTVTAVRASVLTAQTSGSILTIDINENGTSILSTKLSIDNSEKTSTTAATPYVISDTSLADDAEITIDIDQVGTSPAGLIVWIIGY